MKPRPAWQRLAPWAVLLALAGIVYFQHAQRAETAAGPRLHCPDPVTGCATQLGGRPITVGMDAQRRVMQPFNLWVRASGARRVRASFTMEDMDMGLNLYTLQADKEGVFRGRITLPVCVTGTREWLLTLEVDDDRLILPFDLEL